MGEDIIDFETFDIDELCAKVIAQLHPKALARNMSLALISRPPLSIYASKTLIEAMLINILDNAILYSKDDDNIQVIVEKSATDCHILVVDHGPGLSKVEREEVWQRFFRANYTQANGSGLGLSIVREIIYLHAGQCELTPTEGGGVTVKIRLALPISST